MIPISSFSLQSIPTAPMGDIDLDPEIEKEKQAPSESIAYDVQTETPTAGMHKDPSFSGWCKDNRLPPDESDGGATNEESEGFELPLLLRGDSTPRSDYFRQRSMHSNPSEGITRNGKRYSAFDVENGMHASDSRAKLDSFEQAAQSSVSAVMVLKTLFYILVWYTFSTCLTLYNKSLLGDKLGKFPAPFLMNTFHFALQAVLSKVIIWFQSRESDAGVPMTWRDYFIRVVPTAFGTALDINLSNASLVFISVTLATMSKSASPIFLLLFAFAFRLESPSIKLFGIIFIISVGVLLTVAKEAEFQLLGFVLIMLASVMSGFRWSMTQILLQKEAYGLKNPITLMGYVSPVMAIATAVLSLVMDPWHNFGTSTYFDSPWHTVRSCLLMLIGGALAFFMVLTEYVLVSATSAVTVMIAGVVKEAITILVAVLYFHDQFTWLKGLGLLTIIAGVILFNCYKYQKLRRGQPSEGEEALSPTSNGAAKYVILDEMDLQDDDI